MIESAVRRLQPNKLIFLNELLGIPLELIAEQLGVSQPYLSIVKSGQRKLSTRMSHKLNKVLDQVLTELDNSDDIPPGAYELLEAIITHGEKMP